MDTRTEQLIESWFDNTISAAERAELRLLLANDPESAAEFAWQQSLSRAVGTGTLMTGPLRTELDELERRFRFRRIILQISALAAIFLALFVAVRIFNQPGTGPDETQIAATHDTLPNPGFIPQVNTPVQDSPASQAVTGQEKQDQEQDRKQAERALQQQKEAQRKQRALRDSLRLDVVANFRHFSNKSEFNNAGGVDKAEEMAMKAFVLYDKKEYAQAVQAFKPIVEANPGNMEYRFYYGVALLGDHQFDESVNVFRQVAEQAGNYQTPAKFYLGLANTGAGQYKAAQQAFQDYLASPNNRQFKGLAESMLQKLPSQ